MEAALTEARRHEGTKATVPHGPLANRDLARYHVAAEASVTPRFNIYLMGPRACGKTTLGRWLAEELHWTFVDLDDVALARFPERSICAIWERHGEAAWRDAEVAALEEVLRSNHQIVGLGGGTPMIAEARQRLDRAKLDGRALLIYLKVDAETLRQRLAADEGDRPSLTGGGVADEVEGILREREPAYLHLADIVCGAAGELETVKQRLLEAIPDRVRGRE